MGLVLKTTTATASQTSQASEKKSLFLGGPEFKVKLEPSRYAVSIHMEKRDGVGRTCSMTAARLSCHGRKLAQRSPNSPWHGAKCTLNSDFISIRWEEKRV